MVFTEGLYSLIRKVFMSRTEGSYIKKLEYQKFYFISFKYREHMYVLCQPFDKLTFLNISTARSEDLEDMNIKKYTTKDEAHTVAKQIPSFEFAGNEVYLDVYSNTHYPEIF